MEKLKGLISAPYTAFDKEGKLNVDIIPAYANYLKENGIAGVFVNGTTGEGASLTNEERLLTAIEWCKQKSDDFKVIIHVGHNSLENCQLFANHAQSISADGIGLMAPNFFKPATISDLVAFNAEVASVAPNLPYYYYHIPSMTGVNFPMVDFLEAAEMSIPNLAGIKFTYEDLMDMKLCLAHANQKYDILHGRDETLLCGLLLGAKGAIGSTYNYLGPLYSKIIKAYNANDLELANKLQLESMKIIKILIKYGGAVKSGKSFMRLVGLDFGNPRLPMAGLSPNEEISLEADLKLTDFFSYSGCTVNV